MAFKLDLSLRTRFITALVVVAMLLSGGYYYAMNQFIEVLEAELGTQSMMRDLNAFTHYHLQNPSVIPAEHDGIKTYVYAAGADDSDLPPPLKKWGNGKIGEFKWHDYEYQAVRHDIGDTRIYMTLDLARVERLERRLVIFALVFIASALILAAFVGVGLSLLVTRPVSRLAHLVTNLHPTQRGIKIGDEFGNREVGKIAHAFDTYLQKIDQYVARERAFTDDASHELRTPLSTIISATQLLEEDSQLSGSNLERLARIRRAAAQMKSIIEALLYLAREDGGLTNDACLLHQMLQESANSQRDQITAQGLSIHVEILAPVTVHAPHGMVQCVIQNLMSNAIQHSGQGRIEVQLSEHQFVVQDNGSGIEQGSLDHIFERRYRGAQSRGLGLGLYLVQRICDRLGWRIEVSNAQGAGARFVVKF